MEELLSFKKSKPVVPFVRFLFRGEGLDVYLVDLFFTSFLLAVLLLNEFPQPLHLHLSAEHELLKV